MCIYTHGEREGREGRMEGDRKGMNIDIIVRNFYKSSFHKSVSSGVCTRLCVYTKDTYWNVYFSLDIYVVFSTS